MNRKKVFSMVGEMLKVEALLLILPIVVAAIYREKCILSLAAAAVIAAGLGFGMKALAKPTSDAIYAREGFLITALSWLAMSAVGALPFFISREIPSYIDAFFETVSGFTTTGASILTNVEVMSKGLLFWRSFSHWVGGMGILVFMMAIVPGANDSSLHIMRAEMPGPVVGKLTPRAKDTAMVLYIIYVALTVLEMILLLCGGMNLYESMVHSFGTAGTGGFGVRCDSIGGYNAFIQWVITVFMFLFGVNFNLYFLLMVRRFKAAAQSSEFFYYFGIVAVSIVLITINVRPLYKTFEETVRTSAFQVASIITTTGYATTDFNLWPGLSKAILLMLMMVGACAGSTGGGLKVSRAVMLCKMSAGELKRMLHPRAVNTMKFEGQTVDRSTQRSVSSYFVLYALVLVVVFLILSIEPYDLETNLSAAISCFNNIGPAFNLAGPAANYAFYSPLSKVVLSFAMLFGRLEILPMLLMLTPRTWSRKL